VHEFLLDPALEALKIAAIVFAMMVAVDLANMLLEGRLASLLGRGRWAGYLVAAFLGATPGCAGAFLAVSLYAHGALSFGALLAAMVATTGDEAFVMLARFRGTALALFGALFLLGVAVGWIADRFAGTLRFPEARECAVPHYHPGEEGLRHFLKEHVLQHALLHHVPRIFAWTFAALVLVAGIEHWLPGEGEHLGGPLMIGLAALVGLVPASGPHLVFVTMYAKGLVPLSVLVASSISQNGHGVLPLLSVSRPDVLRVKAATLVLGLAGGFLLLLLGT